MSKQIPHGKTKHNSFIMNLMLVTQFCFLIPVLGRKKKEANKIKETKKKMLHKHSVYCGFPFPLDCSCSSVFINVKHCIDTRTFR